ncbi:MASE1 domain-containing protein [Stenotrophomonas sp. HMSC10F06]|nr:MASE1 domain-containing protein [Stenotrophomonas sp. HMSC10F06]
MAFDWLRRDIHLHVRLHPGGVLLAVSYAVAFWAARNVSVDQLYLPAGLRVAALLLCPPRYWVYLIAGEYAFFALARYPLIPQYGLAWVVVASASLMPAVAGIVHTHRRWMASSNDTWLLSVALLAAIVVTALNQGLAYLLMPTQHVAVSWEGAARYAVGDYLGILLIAPLVVMWRRRRMAAESMRG